jgi:cardiolipin synthase
MLGARFLHPRGPLARDHRKVLVVDGRVGFVGGLNLSAQWEASGSRAGWRDTAARVIGLEAGAHLRALFESTWTRLGGAVRTTAPELWGSADSRIGVLANTPEDRRRRRIRQAYLWAIRRAKRSVDITAAYFAPRRLFVRALARAVKHGVRVRLLLPEKSDVLIADLLARPFATFLEGLGVEVYAYRGRTLHAKTAVVDDRLVTVGSHNLDALSWAYNLECNIVVSDAGVGRVATDLFEEDLAQAVRFPSRRRRGLDEVGVFLGRAAERLYRA